MRISDWSSDVLFRSVLAVAVGAPVVLAALLLEHQDLVAAGLLDDLAGHADALDEGGAGLGPGTLAEPQDGLDGDDLAGIASQLPDDAHVILGDLVLLDPGFEPCTHGAGPHNSS